ncbi:armadillo repeat-containing protein 1 isoform X3 [Falco rusticolus]|uniref:armadillo repeat-containing protein 1 isoform X3 n=1 Tax=Falco rusticolus TaxID=120794 RepID=UPI001886A5DA|nr:armadillo repeat-containing protein 1 isoform X3 [Falco rusticolus]
MHAAEKMNSTMSEEPDALSVVNQLRDLAADPLNRRAIVQDQGCLPGLILFLDHPNPPVVHSALLGLLEVIHFSFLLELGLSPALNQALRYLAECRANREKMKSELGMMLSLQNVIQKTTTPGETKLLASEVYDILQSSNMSDTDNVNEMNYRRRKAQFFLGSTNKRAKTVVLHIDGLDDSVSPSKKFRPPMFYLEQEAAARNDCKSYKCLWILKPQVLDTDYFKEGKVVCGLVWGWMFLF